MRYRIFEYDPGLIPYERDIKQRYLNYKNKKAELVGKKGSLNDFANAHQYFGFHRTADGWVYREWAPAADALYLIGDMNGWEARKTPLKKLDNGVFEVYLEGENALWHGCKVKTLVQNGGRFTEHIPLYAKKSGTGSR